MSAVNFTALPLHLPQARRDAASRRGQRRAAGVVPEEYGLRRAAVKGQGGQGGLGITS